MRQLLHQVFEAPLAALKSNKVDVGVVIEDSFKWIVLTLKEV